MNLGMEVTNDLVMQVRDLSEQVTLLEEEKERFSENTEKIVRALKEKSAALEEKEKEWAEREEEVSRLEAEDTHLRSREIDQGVFTKSVVEKVLRKIDFGELVVKMSVAATNIRKQEVLNSLMIECPQLRLKKQRFGWDPYAQDRANKRSL